uniref:Predicted protein n=1 Tax=Hordeum vulgare subsp. vulgare TaxID=112509 RepID=F2DLH2_HORVV|nr:predicted protein [Hordeum vulgare subsp. vulgare]
MRPLNRTRPVSGCSQCMEPAQIHYRLIIMALPHHTWSPHRHQISRSS